VGRQFRRCRVLKCERMRVPLSLFEDRSGALATTAALVPLANVLHPDDE
jgi:hypothetical protein